MKWITPLQNFDAAVFLWCMARKRRQPLVALSRVVSKTGDGWLYLLGFFGLWAAQAVSPRLLWLIALAYGVERALYFVLKNSLKRHRPAQAIDGFSSAIQPHDQFSFPSGHTSAAFLSAALIGVLLPPLAWLGYIWAAGVGLSRIVLGVHFPGDVVMGAILGTSIAWVVLI